MPNRKNPKNMHLFLLINQRVPVRQLDLQTYPLTPEQQDQLVVFLQSVPNQEYVSQLIKKLIQIYEQNDYEVSENVYETAFSPQIISPTDLSPDFPDTLTYPINGSEVSIQEAPNVFHSNGTTGRRTWEAGLYLSSILHTLQLSGTVCELGTGTALVGIAVMKLQSVEKAIVTDGFAGILGSVQHNISLNNISSSKYDIKQLIWGEDECPSCDYVIGSDVTYDDAALAPLVVTIGTFLGNGCKKAFIAATVRNPETLDIFEQQLAAKKLQWSIKDIFTPNNNDTIQKNRSIWYKSTTPIRLYEIWI